MSWPAQPDEALVGWSFDTASFFTGPESCVLPGFGCDGDICGVEQPVQTTLSSRSVNA